MEIRIIEEDYPDDPYMNLAMDEAIFIEVEKGRSPPTLRFYRNRNAVILGCFQLAEQEVDLAYAALKNITIAKRFTGGGAVYHDMGNLNYSVISRDCFGIGLKVDALFGTMMAGATESLRLADVPEIASGMNDVTSKGKKIMGSAATMKKGVILFHAALLVDTDLNELASVLKVPGIKLKDKGVKTILERVANINALCGKNVDQIRQSVKDGYSSKLGFSYNERQGALTSEERRLLGRLYSEKYSKSGWNMGREFITLKD
jgi:lipoate-protein ligase A